MSTENIAAALLRVQGVLQRKPQIGLHDDAPATAQWLDGLRVVASHANGTQMVTDMPIELGGQGDQVTPGWVFRAGLASCFATCIAMHAAARGVALSALEVRADSRSDLRGLFGMLDAAGERVVAGPIDARLTVRIAANGIARGELHRLIEESYCCSPMAAALREAVSISLAIETEGE